MVTQNNLEVKKVNDLLGLNFYIPEYQRGYRWTKQHVLDLLDDIWEYRTNFPKGSFYCLQPIVVKEKTWLDEHSNTEITGFELIDGQQRLTTIHRIITYLLLEYLNDNSLVNHYGKELYNLYYKTRPGSKEFLSKAVYDASSLDYYYMSEAYTTIKDWFSKFNRPEKERVINTILETNEAEHYLGFIWYQIRDEADSVELFTRLNRGKIPLTSAELIKAKFLNSKSFKGRDAIEQVRRKTEIVQIWDEMEQQLHDSKFWSFVSNRPQESYSTKIELLFDIKTNKSANEADPLFTYLHFFEDDSEETMWNLWLETESYYQTIKYWYNDRNYYHQIGFLICAGEPIRNLITHSSNSKKSEFNQYIASRIKHHIKPEISSLRYHPTNNRDIINILLLFNLETMRLNKANNEFFPFAMYKSLSKSLEHIHAQNIEGVSRTKKVEWVSWLKTHLEAIKNLENSKDDLDNIISVIEDAIKNSDNKNFNFEKFEQVATQVLSYFRIDGDESDEYMHRIENLALIGQIENVMLSNSVFEVKRQKIIDMDKEGAFIPICTKRVFFKYYSNNSDDYKIYWTEEDRKMYLQKIEETLQPYLTNHISVTNED